MRRMSVDFNFVEMCKGMGIFTNKDSHALVVYLHKKCRAHDVHGMLKRKMRVSSTHHIPLALP